MYYKYFQMLANIDEFKARLKDFFQSFYSVEIEILVGLSQGMIIKKRKFLAEVPSATNV